MALSARYTLPAPLAQLENGKHAIECVVERRHPEDEVWQVMPDHDVDTLFAALRWWGPYHLDRLERMARSIEAGRIVTITLPTKEFYLRRAR